MGAMEIRSQIKKKGGAWMKKLFALLVILAAVGCVQPQREYNLHVSIAGYSNTVEVKTEAMVEKQETLEADQNVSPQVDVSVVP